MSKRSSILGKMSGIKVIHSFFRFQVFNKKEGFQNEMYLSNVIKQNP